MLGLGTLIGIMAIPSVAISAVKGAIAGAVVAKVNKAIEKSGVLEAIDSGLTEAYNRHKNSNESSDSKEQ